VSGDVRGDRHRRAIDQLSEACRWKKVVDVIAEDESTGSCRRSRFVRFERYLAEGEATGLSFVDWVSGPTYDLVAMKANFRAGWWGTAITERLLRPE